MDTSCIFNILDNINYKENSTVVFDIDNTLIINGIVKTKIVNIYRYFVRKGIYPYIITGRKSKPEIISYTQNQLDKINLKYSGIYFRPLNSYDIAKFKQQARHDIIKKGKIIELSIGDKHWDYKGKYCGIGIKV